MKFSLDLKKGSWSLENTPSITARSMFYYIQSAGHFFTGSDYVTVRENYNTMLLLYTLSGKGYLNYRDEKYELSAGRGFLINCMDYQGYGTDDNEWEFKWVHFNGSESRQYFERIYEHSGPVFSKDEPPKKGSPETSEKNCCLVTNLEKIHSLLKKRDPGFDIIASNLIVNILTELLLKTTRGEPDTPVPEPVQLVITKIENSFYEPLDLDLLVNGTGVSKYHLARLFKKYTGYGPYEYLINYRLNQAKSMLKTSTLTVQEIGQRVGFNSSSHFIKIFKQHENTTPLQFRKYFR